MFMGEIYHISQGVIKKVEESELYKHWTDIVYLA
jgi:hypothetical protein